MSTPDVLRIGNCSGFFGDRTGAAREMVDGGPLDVLTGDWLAELTMYILHKTRQRSGGYARTFLRELEEVLPTCMERGITVVSNAGGLQPAALADAVRELARRQGLDPHVASVSGDDITPQLGRLQAQGGEVRQPRHGRGAAGQRLRRDGERLPAGASDRRCARRRRADRRDRPRDRCCAGGRPGTARVRLVGRRPRRHCRRGGGGARH